MLDSATLQFNALQFTQLTPRFEAFFARGRAIYGIDKKTGQRQQISTKRNLIMKEDVKDLLFGGYFPKVWIQYYPYERPPFNIRLVIELSVPKFFMEQAFTSTARLTSMHSR